MKKKLLCCLLCVGMLLSILSACANSSESNQPTSDSTSDTSTSTDQTTTEAGQGKTTMRIAVNMDAPGFCPYTSGYNPASTVVIKNVYETLINMDGSGNLYPGLATEWEYGEDNVSVILTLREGVSFTNGEAFNADSVIFALRDYRGATAVGGEGETLYDFDNMEKLGDYQVEIPLKRLGSDAFIELTDQSYSICSKTAAEEYGDDYRNNPVGTGAYKFVSFTSGVGAVMEANEDYWDGAPAIKTIETVLISEGSQAQIELESGNIDLIVNPDYIDVARIENDPSLGLKVLTLPSSNVKNLWFNFRKETMQDVNLRKAISCAIDKEAIIDVVYEGNAVVANQKIAATNGAYDPAYDEDPMYPYDLELAKEYLAQSNYPDGLNLTIYSDTTPSEVHIMECIKSDLAQIGIEVEIFALDSNVAVPALIEGEEDDLYCAISCGSAGYAPSYLENSSPNMTPNWGRWDLVDCNEEIYALYEKALAAADTDSCNEYVKEAIRIEMENAMAVPLCYPTSYMTCSAKLENVTIDGGNAAYVFKDAYFTE